MSTRFAAGNDEVQCAIGGCNITGAFTLALIIKKNLDATYQALIGNHTSGGVSQFALEVDASNHLELQVGAQGRQSTTTVTAADNWVFVAVTKAAGASTAQFWFYKAGSWTLAQNATGTNADPATQASGTVRFGEWADSDDYNGWIAVAGEWTSALSSANIQTLANNATPATAVDWLALSPVGFWEFNVNPVLDGSSIGTADESARTGTTLDGANDPAFYTYGVPADNTTKPALPGMFTPQLVETAWF